MLGVDSTLNGLITQERGSHTITAVTFEALEITGVQTGEWGLG